MSRASFGVRLARGVQALPLRLFQFIEWPFLLLFGRSRRAAPALFVLALPRSGSTVTYQLICHGLDVQYLSNLWNLCYQLPLLGGWLSSFGARGHRSDFQSEHGFVPGLDGPAEGLRFWRWWLDAGLSDHDCHSLRPNVLHRRIVYLNRVLKCLTRRGAPFASAYLGHVLVPDRVQRAFTGAALICLRRDPVSNALSLLKSMRTTGCTWFSVVPEECGELEGAGEHVRVAAQVYWLNRRLDQAACSGEMLTVSYESLCSDPAGEIERIRAWCLRKGVAVRRKYVVPDKLDFKVADIDADPDARKIEQALIDLEERYGRLVRQAS